MNIYDNLSMISPYLIFVLIKPKDGRVSSQLVMCSV